MNVAEGLPELVLDEPDRFQFRVNRLSMTSGELWEVEQRTIFDRCWLYVGHASEVAEHNQVRARTVAGRPLILCRDEDGGLQVFLNSCPHRGATLCREKATSGRFLRCFFHAWTFDTRGCLISLPDPEGYGPEFDRATHGLVSPPRVDSYQGFVFASFDPEAEDLLAYLGDACRYLDLLVEHGDGEGLEVGRHEQEYSIAANWKLLMENSIDGYHGLPTHKRWFDVLKASGVDIAARVGGVRSRVEDLGHGHAITLAPPLALEPPAPELLTFERERRARREERLGPGPASELDVGRAMLIFPNLIVIDLPPGITIRRVEPVSPGRMDVQAWFVLPRGEPDALRRWRLNFSTSFWGPGGLGTPDDIEALECCQRGFGGVREQPWSDISRGMHKDRPSAVDELQMRIFWRRWNALVTGKPHVGVRR
jgi:benzoate/toluate 1,2-dioxygenase alpha subunit